MDLLGIAFLALYILVPTAAVLVMGLLVLRAIGKLREDIEGLMDDKGGD
jgi:hypothetical protein